jgi:Low-density lipoprotein receptor repeat class B
MKNENQLNAPRLFILDGKLGKIVSIGTDGSDAKTILDCGQTPDGIAIDIVSEHIYWTNMGQHFDQNDGFIERVNFDGTGRVVIIPKGKTFTPKQLKLDLQNRLMYWCDREGMRVMRAQLNGENITTLVQTGTSDADRSDETRHCVGIALDTENKCIYWTQKGPSKGGKGRIFRASISLPPGQDPLSRNDIEVLWDHLPEPIDLELNHQSGDLYWTDRGAPPNGNTLNRANIQSSPVGPIEILSTGLHEAIGLALDTDHEMVFFVDLGGSLYCQSLNGSKRYELYSGEGSFTGIVYVPAG